MVLEIISQDLNIWVGRCEAGLLHLTVVWIGKGEADYNNNLGRKAFKKKTHGVFANV